MSGEENQMTTLKGIYRDFLVTADGKLTDHGWRSNSIVDRCRELLAAFMRGDSALGVQFLALGRGDNSWDSTPPEAPSPGSFQLTDSSPVTINVGELTLEYLDAVGAVVTGPTNRIQIAVTLAPGSLPIEPGETSYPLREFGLFGRFDADDYMINYVRHPVINIEPDDTFTRTIQLMF